MSGLRRLRVRELHPNLLCILCGGYYVDATTIVECLHSFCKTCIVRYLESSKFCPICDVQVHKTKPLLSIRPDKTLQDIVYKLVPGLYQNEMCRRKEFYSSHPETEPLTPEDGGRDLGRWYILPDDPVSVALHPAPSSYSPKCLNVESTPASSIRCPSTKTPLEECEIIHSDVKEKDLDHVRYLQCPAGVSVAQLKRLLRAKFGVGPTHPIAMLSSTSADPLSDTLTLVDVAYITSWQRMEPLQLQYRIYERASKKIKLDPDTFSADCYNEGMPKLEPSVGNGVNISLYANLDATGNVMEYANAPCLQAFTSDCDTALPKEDEEKPLQTDTSSNSNSDTGGIVGEMPSECKDCTSDAASGVKPDNTLEASREKLDVLPCVSGSTTTELTQGSHSDIGNVMKTNDAGGGLSCDNNPIKVANVTSGNNVVDTFVTYTRAYTAPSNGVNVGVTFIPSEMGYIGTASVPCAIIPSGGCVPVSGNCIPGSVSVPTMCSSATLHRPLQGEGMTTDNVNLWVAAGLLSEAAILPVENKRSVEDTKEGEEEGKEVQLTISESGIMSASGRGTTVEGLVNAIESEACELLSKIESGSLGEDFPPKTSDSSAQKIVQEPNTVNKKPKAREMKSADVAKSKVDGKSYFGKNIATKGEKVKNVTFGNVASSTVKKSNVSKDERDIQLKERASVENIPDAAITNKTVNESHETVAKKVTEFRKPGEVVHKDIKEGNNYKDSRSSHIPASLTAASMANLNKPHLKAGPSKITHADDIKSKEIKPISGLNLKKEGKADQKQTTSGSCRKSSQPYGYKTLKTPPKSWNPTISREQLAISAGKSTNGKGMPEVRTNKFFKARNAPRFLGNPSAGIKPMYSSVEDNSSGANSQKSTVVLRVDPKVSMGAVTVPVSNDGVSMACLTTSVSSSTSSMSSGQSSAPSVTNTTMSVTGSLPATTACLTTTASQTGVSETVVSSATEKMLASTKAVTSSSTPLTSVTKESTNSSSKATGSKNATSILEKKVTNDVNKPTTSGSSNNSGSGKTKAKTGTTSRDETVTSMHSSVSSAKSEIVGRTNMVQDTKVSQGHVGQLINTFGSYVNNANISNLHTSTVGQTCSTSQLRPATVSALTACATGFQTQQHFAVGSPTVGIIPSCGVSLPATLGTMPLPYYTSPTLGYPTYPYLYQGPDAIGLIPPHPSASFIPSFPTILPPRSPLSPRNIGGAKMLQELPMQPTILPMVPIVSQVPSQAPSPRPMTPPSPKSSTSSTQSPKPYPMQSPRQSTGHARPLTPHSPKPLTIGHTATRSPAQSPKLQTTEPVKSHLGNQPSLPVTQPPVSTHVPNITPSQISSSKLNACVQTSLSHTSAIPRITATTTSNIASSKPPVPQSPKISVAGSHSNTSPKPSIPRTPPPPSSPKTATSVGSIVMTETPTSRSSNAFQLVNQQQMPQLSNISTSSTSITDTRQAVYTSLPKMAAVSREGLPLSLPPSPIMSYPLPVNQSTVLSPGGFTVPQGNITSTLVHSNAVQLPISHVASRVSQSMSVLGNSDMMSYNKGNIIPEVSSSVKSNQFSSPITTFSQSSIPPTFTPLITAGSPVSFAASTNTYTCIAPVSFCTSLPQALPVCSSTSSINTPSSLTTLPVFSTPDRPVSSTSTAETPKLPSTVPNVVPKESVVSSPVSTNVSTTSSSVVVNSNTSTSCVTGVHQVVLPKNVTSVPNITDYTVKEPLVTLPFCTSYNYSVAPNTVVNTANTTVLSASSNVATPSSAEVTVPKSTTAVTSSPVTHKDALTTKITPCENTLSSVVSTYTPSTTTSLAISPSTTGSTSVPCNGTSGIISPQCEKYTPPVSSAVIAQSPNSKSECSSSNNSSSGHIHPTGSDNNNSTSSGVVEKPKSEVEKSVGDGGGSIPHSSACTPVCDVSHVIDAKLPCTAGSECLGGGSSDGPRPCLKS